MTRFRKGIVVLICVACLGVPAIWQGTQPAWANQSGEAQKVEEPFRNVRVLVEAFVVEVDLQQLYEMGVCPLGSRPNSVSVDHILKCLSDGKGAEIVSGAKLALKQNERGSLEQNVSITKTVGNRGVTRSNSPQKTFGASVFVMPSGEISIGYSFSMVTVSDSNEDSSFTKSIYSWSSDACFEAGKPQIAGEIQEGTKAVFLIITADIR